MARLFFLTLAALTLVKSQQHIRGGQRELFWLDDPKTIETKGVVTIQEEEIFQEQAHYQDDINMAGGAEFIFLIAIEGSGHHLYSSIYERSPAKRDLIKLRPHISDKDVFDLHFALFNTVNLWTMKDTGLFSAPCAPQGPTNNHKPNGLNGTAIFERVSRKMKSIDERVRLEQKRDTPLIIPLNSAMGSQPEGMMSYPNFAGACRSLQYPDLDALYASCDAAAVSCRHIVLTRDPYRSLESTWRRHRNLLGRGVSPATLTKEFTTMLDVINVQIQTHPDRLAVCWNFTEEPEDELGRLLGWGKNGTDIDDFRSTYDSLFVRKTLTEEQRLEIVPPEIDVYMSSMIKAVQRVQKSCRDTLNEREESDKKGKGRRQQQQ